MKYFIVFVALMACAVSAYAASYNFGKTLECLKQSREAKIGESTIRNIIEKLRKSLLKYDPLDIDDKHITFNHKLLNLDSTLTIASEGLAGFNIDKLSFSLIGLKFKISLRWPEVFAKGSYGLFMNSTLYPQNIVGKGTFDWIAKNFVFNANGAISVSIIGLKPTIKKLSVDMHLEDFALKLTGLMNDEELSEKVSNHLTENLPQIIEGLNSVINDFIDKNLDNINNIIGGKKLFSDAELARINSYLIACGDMDY